MDKIQKAKNELRIKMQEQRNSLNLNEYLSKNETIHSFFNSINLSLGLCNFMFYVNVGKEANTKNIIGELILKDYIISVPICVLDSTQLIPSKIKDLRELGPAHFNLLEPRKEFIRPVNLKDIEVVIIPGLAFDKDGNRLGHGKGYYDRFLARLAPETIKIAFAYDFQIIEEVPFDAYDIPMDFIISDKRIYECPQTKIHINLD